MTPGGRLKMRDDPLDFPFTIGYREHMDIGTYEGAVSAFIGDMEYLSAGSARIVYRDGDIVYKVNRANEDDANAMEFQAAISMTDLPDNVRIPRMSLWKVQGEDVIAMEFIPGVPMGECYCIIEKEAHLPSCLIGEDLDIASRYLNDYAGENVIRHDGILYLIDLDGESH